MGWTGLWERPASPKKYLDQQFGPVQASAMRGSVYYAAKNGYALVVITKRTRDEWLYKEMDESMGPYQYNCPRTILSLLSEEPPNDYAREWRERCKAIARVSPGMKLKFNRGIYFNNGQTYDTLTKLKGSRFKTEDGITVRLRDWSKREFTICIQ